MPDLRELFPEPEEAQRALWDGLVKHIFTALPCIVAKDSDGRTVTLQPAIKQALTDQTYNDTSYVDFPLLQDAPVHFPGGGGVTLTHAVKEGDEHLGIASSRSIDVWNQSGGVQQPIFNRLHSLSDVIGIPGIRSMPRALQQISTEAAHLRSDDGKHTIEQHPQNGITVKSVDPSTPPASESFSPFLQATKFFLHSVLGASGVLGQAVDGSTTHAHGVTHQGGAYMSALNALHQVLCHPTMGALLSAENGAHVVRATPEGVVLSSTSGISLSAPSLSLPSGGVSGDALAGGAASQNIGALGGDLSGDLPNPQVVSIAHLVGMDHLPRAASDSAAAALTPPVPIGSPYLNTSVSPGVALLAIRIA